MVHGVRGQGVCKKRRGEYVEDHASSVSYKQAVQYCPLRKSAFARLRCWKNTEHVEITMNDSRGGSRTPQTPCQNNAYPRIHSRCICSSARTRSSLRSREFPPICVVCDLLALGLACICAWPLFLIACPSSVVRIIFTDKSVLRIGQHM